MRKAYLFSECVRNGMEDVCVRGGVPPVGMVDDGSPDTSDRIARSHRLATSSRCPDSQHP